MPEIRGETEMHEATPQEISESDNTCKPPSQTMNNDETKKSPPPQKSSTKPPGSLFDFFACLAQSAHSATHVNSSMEV